MNSRRCAFIDIGTNTILGLIAELKKDDSFDVLDDLAEITRLGEGVQRTGRISPEAEERSLQVQRRYLDRCKDLLVEEIIAVRTRALRDRSEERRVGKECR